MILCSADDIASLRYYSRCDVYTLSKIHHTGLKGEFTSAPNESMYRDVIYPTLDVAFICQAADFSAINPMDDIEQAMFIPLGAIDLDRFAFPSIRGLARQFKNYFI